MASGGLVALLMAVFEVGLPSATAGVLIGLCALVFGLIVRHVAWTWRNRRMLIRCWREGNLPSDRSEEE